MLLMTKILGYCLIAFALVTACTSYTDTLPALAQLDQPQTFTTQMSGGEEVPPVTTSATGTAEFNSSPDGISYQLSLSDISDVTAAHIHSGNVGENGPVIVTLYSSDTAANQTDGVFAQGLISADDLEGSMQGKEISDLISEMSNGVTYVNVHTQAYPDGEIRGQN
jgi:hypothetical protein